MNTANTNPIPLRGEPIEDVDSFTYLGSIVSKTGGTDEDVKARIQKARNAFLMMKNIWKSGNIRLQTKLQLFNSNVRSVLLYGSEKWRTKKYTITKVQTFVNKCLRWILGIRWVDEVTNVELWRRSQQEPVSDIIRRRKWRWIGHSLRKPVMDITRHVLNWNPAGKRRRGVPRNTWQREVEDEAKKGGNSWPQIKKMAKNNPGAYAGGSTGCTCTLPPPTWEKVPLRNVQKRRESSTQICRQKRMCTFRSDTTKSKRKRKGKKKKIVKGKG